MLAEYIDSVSAHRIHTNTNTGKIIGDSCISGMQFTGRQARLKQIFWLYLRAYAQEVSWL